MRNIFRKVYSVVGVLILADYVLQLYFIAGGIFTITSADDNQKSIYSAFKNADNNFLGLHAANGWLIGLLIIIFFIVSFAARLPLRTSGLNGLLFVLIVVQLFLAHTGIPAVSALHGINALILIGLTGYLTGRNWAFGLRPAQAASSQEAVEPSPVRS
jgi:Family of unknown function (DUF6220)